MKRFLAKSNPEQTIQEHTDMLLDCLELLKKTYPSISVKWDLLRWSCIYHDLGKINNKFQDKIQNNKRHTGEIAHNLLSLAFINTVELKEMGYSKNDIKIIAQSVARHHDRGDYNDENYNSEVEFLKEEVNNFQYDKYNISRVKKISVLYFSNDRCFSDSEFFLEYIMVKGLLNRLDYAASAGISVEVPNDFLNRKLEKLITDSGFKWNALQQFMKLNTDNNVVAVAQTGMGKTEAGLLWIGDNKGFFTLPLKTAINEIYIRVVDKIVGTNNRELVGLLHSDTYSKYIEYTSKEIDDYSEGINIEEYYSKTRQLSLPLTITTLDQIFDFVFRYRDFEPKLATLSYSKIVIDEIQMYSPDLIAYLIIGLDYINKVGGKFAILTATLPGFITDLMRKHKIEFVLPEKPFINDLTRHSIKVIHTPINPVVIKDYYSNNKILIICNTVKKAREVYESLVEYSKNNELGISSDRIKLLHSGFIKRDRKQKENEIFATGQVESLSSEIWVTTQVVEASLDIDFDLLFTELSDVNGLFQRLGRCYRKRKFIGDGYNCFVFDGGEELCSGVKYVIDEDIHNMSKEAIKNIDGIITEQDKIEIIDSIYSTEKLSDTKYFKKVIDNIKYVSDINEYELDKKEMRERFRNIDTISVIPEPVYTSNKAIIDGLLEQYKILTNGKERNTRKEKAVIAEEINSFTVNVRYSKQLISSEIALSKYNRIPVMICDYDYNKGVVINKVISKEEESNFL